MEMIRHVVTVGGHILNDTGKVNMAKDLLIDWYNNKKDIYHLIDDYKIDTQTAMANHYEKPITKFQITCFSNLSLEQLKEAGCNVI